MTAQDKQHLESLIRSARIVVRETGLVAQIAEEQHQHGAWEGEYCPTTFYRQIMHAYDMACAHLIQIDPIGGPDFIKSTYGPAFRQTEAAK